MSLVLSDDGLLRHNKLVREYFYTIYETKIALLNNDIDKAAQAMGELTQETRAILWLAPTKGGIFTTQERGVMMTKEFMDAIFLYSTKQP